MDKPPPLVVIIAGPNGAGKSTAAPYLLRDALKVTEFVNMDVIAQGLSGFSPEGVNLEAGRMMLKRLDSLAQSKTSFAFETTLASRSILCHLEKWKAEYRYEFHLIYLWLHDEQLALERVSERVRSGGHAVPEEVVRRRYHAGLMNFFQYYQPLTDGWLFFDNSLPNPPVLIAAGAGIKATCISNREIWQRIKEQYGEPTST